MNQSTLSKAPVTAAIDLSAYRFNACIDWIELYVQLRRPSNFNSIRKNFQISFVKGIDASSSHATSDFRFRMYDIKRWDELDALLAAMENEYGFSAPVCITGVEVSLDGYSRNEKHEELVALTAHYFKFLQRPVSKNRRFSLHYKGSAKGTNTGRHIHTVKFLREGRTGYIGNQEGEADTKSQRIYVKVTDNNKKALNPSQHRGRYEITLQGSECPFVKLQEARNFNFTGLSDYFAFRRLKGNQGRLMDMLMDIRSHVGLVSPQRRKNGGMRKNNRRTVADSKMNAISYDALRNLTKRLQP